MNFPEQQPGTPLVVDFRQRPVLRHPLAGRQLDLGNLRSADGSETQKEAVKALCIRGEDDRKRFLRLWRGLTRELEGQEERPGLPQTERLGKLWGLLPADTRMPDHPLMQHLSMTAAIATALPKPALLIFSLGPVQGFIATARRAQDLWMGSYILSYLAWQGIKAIASGFGPDAVIYPSLRGQPLSDLWLQREEKVWGQGPTGAQLRIATFPNKFVALLSAGQANQAARDVEKAVREAWKQLADKVQNQLAIYANVGNDQIWLYLWRQQIPRLLEIYWCVYPWAGMDGTEPTGNSDDVIAQYSGLCRPPADWPFKCVYDIYAKPAAIGGGQFDPNVGATYSLLYDLADRGFNARKGLRNFEPGEEHGAKCTLCGQRQALRTRTKDERSFWADLAGALQQQTRYEVKPEGAERLCAVCAVKRFVQREVFDSELGLRGGFPSTSTVAAAAFCKRLLERLAKSDADELWDAFQAFVYALQRARDRGGKSIPETRMDVPMLTDLTDRLPRNRQDAGRGLLKFDADWLFEETYSAERLKRDYALDFDEGALAGLRAALGRVLHVVGERPARYFAVLTMDGDFAGRWLSGTHPGLTAFGQVLHPNVHQDLTQRAEWAVVLNTQRLVTPAVHAAISEGLANFALQLVPWVVEQRYPGRLVYAGGDDVLALVPMEHALAVARELRALFSGEALIRPNGELEVQFGNSTTSGYLWFQGEPVLTMGPTATASIGIAIAHHLSPLDATLNAVREAEQAAKAFYGRNALCVHLLKRSGEQVRVGAKWFYPDEYPREAGGDDPGWQQQWGKEVPDTVALLEDVRQRLGEDWLSMKFAHAVFEQATILAGAVLAAQARQAEIYRLAKRQKGDRCPDPEAQAKELAAKLTSFAEALDRHRRKWEASWNQHHQREPDAVDEAGAPQPGMVELAKWVLLMRFIVSGGGGE
ncbi:MAG: type III-B CRISPR-associated protein Cas10/Cmr2 [Bryobacteraceae bacterium]|nr:type III-B CRISPR-associated protein Cas10/Cmr2 [Bryobacteraceae bacterium]